MRRLNVQPDHTTFLLVLTATSGDGQWGSAAEVREVMAGKGIVKNPAWSYVEDQMQAG